MCVCIYIFFFIIRVKACVIPCPHQLPTRGDKTISVAEGNTATPGATKQLLPWDSVFKRIIYICQVNLEQRLHWMLIFIFSVQFVIYKNQKRQKTLYFLLYNRENTRLL